MSLRAFVIHWNAAEIQAKVRLVETCGMQAVGHEAEDGERAMNAIKELEPNVLLVWLSRLPSHGRVTAQAVRASSWGRDLPVVFVEGDPDLLEDARMARVRNAVPAALVTTPDRLESAVAAAMLAAREAQQERLIRKATQ
jgi:DNA-binding NarL/FixJ family response regulator